MIIFLGIGLHLRNTLALVIILIFPLAALLYRIHVEEAALNGAFAPTTPTTAAPPNASSRSSTKSRAHLEPSRTRRQSSADRQEYDFIHAVDARYTQRHDRSHANATTAVTPQTTLRARLQSCRRCHVKGTTSVVP